MAEDNRLSPDGARLLRAARDQILAHPRDFGMDAWDCGTFACIGGHLGRLLGFSAEENVTVPAGIAVSVACGFGAWHPSDQTRFGAHHTHPFYALFYSWDHLTRRNVRVAAERINAFLWLYGFPPDEVPASPVADSAEIPMSASPESGLRDKESSASSSSSV
jgi:hypothetical protein